MGLATNSLSAKFEVSNFTGHDDMKGDTKCTKWGALG